MIAITHAPSPRIDHCELTFVERRPIDVALCRRQHDDYCRLLRGCGVEVVTLDANPEFPDCAFVEDTAIVLDSVALLCSLGAAERRGEVAAMERALAEHRPLRRALPPATLEGGDVLRVGKTLLVGRSPRTNEAGIEALRQIAEPLGYRVTPVDVTGCLHLKTACTALDDSTLLVNPDWIDASPLSEFRQVEVPSEEPWGANVLRLPRRLCMAAENPRTAQLVASLGYDVCVTQLSEFAKAEAGPTCLSLLLA